jgi:hypothetical protein
MRFNIRGGFSARDGTDRAAPFHGFSLVVDRRTTDQSAKEDREREYDQAAAP